MSSKLINDLVKCKSNDWGIWNPVPNALDWCTDGPIEVAGEVAKLNRKYVDENPPVYIQDTVGRQLGKCKNWETKPTNAWKYKVEDLANIVPSYRHGKTGFRFIIITAGPPGSGKSTMNNTIKKKARDFNIRAAKKDWAKIGHDFVIGNDLQFRDTLNELSNIVGNIDDLDHENIYKSINDKKTNWYRLMMEQNELYNKSKSWSETKISQEQKRNYAKHIAKEVYNTISLPEHIELYNELYKLLILTTEESDTIGTNLYSQINNILFQVEPIMGTTFENIFINMYSEDTSPIHNLYNTLYFDNDVLVYLLTAFSILFGLNFTYETTFDKTSSLKFILESCTELTNSCETYNYIILLGFPMVNFNNLIKRTIERYVKWHTNKQGLNIGLPIIDTKNYFTKIARIYLNIASNIYHCNPATKCDGVGIDYIFMFDNNVDIPDEPYDMIRTSDRAHIITPNSAKQRRLETSHKKMIIAILMKALNSLKKAIELITPQKLKDGGIDTVTPECPEELTLIPEYYEGESKEEGNTYSPLLYDSQEYLFSSQGSDYEGTPDSAVETIKGHQEALKEQLQDIGKKNYEEIIEDCMERMEKLLYSKNIYLSKHEIRKQCLVSQKKLLEIYNIQNTPINRRKHYVSKTNERKTQTAYGTKKKGKKHKSKRGKTKKHLNEHKLNKAKSKKHTT